MSSSSQTQHLLGVASLETAVDTGPLDSLTVTGSWDGAPNRIWLTDPISRTPTLNIGLPHDSEGRQTVLKVIDTILSSTETGIGSLDQLLSFLGILGYEIEPAVSAFLTIWGMTISGVGTVRQRLEVRGIVGREKLVFVECPVCDHRFSFKGWNLEKTKSRASTCPDCGNDIEGDTIEVL